MSGKRAALYARVSTAGQAEKGYSLDDQIRTLREYCAREGIEVVEEVKDDGYSGATLERPGLDRVRDLVATGEANLVLAQDRDRFGREPALLWLLQQELEAHGAAMRALNARGDDTPEGELQTGILDQLARYERLKFAERSRRGKRAKARKGKVLPGRYAPFGYRYDPEAATFRVDPPTIVHARRIFEMVGPEGETMTAAAGAMQKAGVLNRSGKPTWYVSTIRGIVDSDVYLSRPFAEVKKIVDPEAAAQLDPEKRYGILWANRVSAKRLHTGTKKFARLENDRSEWVPTPVEDSGIPPEWVLKARENAANGAGRWGAKPSGRVLKGRFFCTCGRRMVVTSKGRGERYYACPKGRLLTEDSTLHAGYHPAEKTEARVRDSALRLARNPELLWAPVLEDVERERRRLEGARAQIVAIHDRLEALDRKRRKYQEMYADDLMSRAELRERLEGIESERATLETERERLSHADAELERLEESMKLLDGFLKDIGWLVEKGLISPAELYDKLNLRIVAHREKRPDGLRRLEAYLGPTRVNEIGASSPPDDLPPLPNGRLTELRRSARARWRSGR